ncbi:hypothetical protein T02_13799 [Trichinella nativa]|uniref:Uncharacterized protein n=1 Tax=Trichinella nativa TaxID=6335 RepID=A0A0V1KUC3_9BILA|nr:hypothetical protein T02_13799 [Trichinella nativa]
METMKKQEINRLGILSSFSSVFLLPCSPNSLHHGYILYLDLALHIFCQNMIIINYPGQQPRSIN